ncbi:hypothetical protein NDU88_003711 [Pleurodeles waltl]|uniref:Uncharacterized protein n=1 Tax=Pleurodeles waltl TaxID=8319 RepID=A0AAV7T5Y6_PLEWA|nr:hypothetical protein NDU88_003711 [Pleurodeles waltl]
MLPWERFHGEAGISRLPRQPPMTRTQRIGQPEAKSQGFPRRRGEQQARTAEQRARTGEQQARTGEQRARTGEQRARTGEQRARTGERRRRTEERRVRRKAAAAVAAVGEDSHTSQKTTTRTEGRPTGRERVETTPEWYRSPRGPDQKTAGPETTERTSTEPATAPEGRGSGRIAGLLLGAGRQSPFKLAWRARFAGRAGLLDCCWGRDDRAPLNLLGVPALRTRRIAGLLLGAGRQSPFKLAWRASFAGRAGLPDCCWGRNDRTPLNLLGAPASRDTQDCRLLLGAGQQSPFKLAWCARFAGRAGLPDCCGGGTTEPLQNLLGAPASRDTQDCWTVAGGGTTEPL